VIPGTEWRWWCDLEVLYLGEIAVGRVAHQGGKGDQPRWLFDLKGAAAFWRTEKTVAAAKGAVEDHLTDWLMRAGLR
jgi:hypothetical protein